MTINQISEKSGITAETLRYYEKIGLIPAVPRNRYGIRIYNYEFLKWLEIIQILKKSGFTLREMQEILKQAKLLLNEYDSYYKALTQELIILEDNADMAV